MPRKRLSMRVCTTPTNNSKRNTSSIQQPATKPRATPFTFSGKSISPQHRNDDHHEDNLAGQNKMKRMLWCGLSPLVVTFSKHSQQGCVPRDQQRGTQINANGCFPRQRTCWCIMLVLQVRMHDHHHTNMLRGAAVRYDTSAPCAPCSSHEHTGTRDVLVVMNVT